MQNFDQLFNIKGKVALVTGGASGIGAMITETLVRAGCRVIIASRKQDALDAYALEMDKIHKDSVIAIAADLSSSEGTEKLIIDVKKHTDHLDILVNNSGCTWGATFDEFPRSAWDKVLNLNVTAMADLTRLSAPLLQKNAAHNNPSRVINIGSVMGSIASSSVTKDVDEFNKYGAFSYTVSKGAVHHMTKLFSNELTPRHITVNAIAPGPFPSRMMAYATDAQEKLDALAETIPLSRVGEPDDIAGTILWLCSSAGAYITGAIIPLDGGLSAKA